MCREEGREEGGRERERERENMSTGNYNWQWIFVIKLRFRVEFVNDFSFWRLDANNYRIRASVVFRLQCETYFNERMAMEFVWNGRGQRLGDRGSDVRGGTVDVGYEGRARRSLKWKCHWRKVKVINGICPSYRVNSMSDAIVATKRDTLYYEMVGAVLSKGCKTDEC